MSCRARCAALWVKSFWDQSLGFRKGSLCLVEFWIRLQKRDVASSCEDTHALDQFVNSTVEWEVFAPACCMNQHCKCLLNASGFMVFSLRVSRALPCCYLHHVPHSLISLHNTGLCEGSRSSLRPCKECYTSLVSHRIVSPHVHWSQMILSLIKKQPWTMHTHWVKVTSRS